MKQNEEVISSNLVNVLKILLNSSRHSASYKCTGYSRSLDTQFYNHCLQGMRQSTGELPTVNGCNRCISDEPCGFSTFNKRKNCSGTFTSMHQVHCRHGVIASVMENQTAISNSTLTYIHYL